MSNESTEKLTELQKAERTITRMRVSIDQYRNELRDAKTDIEVIDSVMKAIVKKYKGHGESSECIIVKLLCSAVVVDVENILKVSSEPVENIIT